MTETVDQECAQYRCRRHQARSRHRCEWDRHLQLRVIASAGALEGVGPGMIEDIFTEAVRFEIGRRNTEDTTLPIAQDEMPAQPSGLARG